jgi:hypothetical protein
MASCAAVIAVSASSPGAADWSVATLTMTRYTRRTRTAILPYPVDYSKSQLNGPAASSEAVHAGRSQLRYISLSVTQRDHAEPAFNRKQPQNCRISVRVRSVSRVCDGAQTIRFWRPLVLPRARYAEGL